MIRRIAAAVALSTLGSLIAANSAFSTTATVGQLFTPTNNCGGPFTYLQTSFVGNSYVIPFNGVITSWSFQDGATPVTGLKLKVGHSVAGGQFVIDAEATAGAQTANTVNTYSASIPVQAGQFIGILQNGGNCGNAPIGGYVITAFNGDLPPSSTPQTPAGTAPASLPVQATVQEVTGQRAAALKRCKKKFRHNKAKRKKCRKKAQLLPV